MKLTVGDQLPDIFTQNETTSTKSKSICQKQLTPSQRHSHEVTKNLISIYKRKRMQIFHDIARTRMSMSTKEFFRIYLNPSDFGKKSSLYRTKFHKKKEKPLNYRMEYERLRGLRESEEELAKVQAYIDKMIARNMKKYEEQKRQAAMKSDEAHYSCAQDFVRSLLYWLLANLLDVILILKHIF